MNRNRVSFPIGVRLFAASLFFSAILNPSISRAATVDTWTGAGTDDNWATAGNFSFSPSGPTTPTSGDSFTFQGTTAPATSNDNETAGFALANLTFSANAQSYTLTGNSFAISPGGTIIDSSTNTQTIDNLVTMSGAGINGTITAGSLALAGGLNGAGTATFTNSLTSVGSTVGVSINGITSTAGQVLTFVTARSFDVINVSLSGALSSAVGSQGFNFNQNGTVTASGITETSGATSWNFNNSGNNSVSGTFSQTAAQKGPIFNFDGTGTSAVTTSMSGTVTVSTGYVAYTADGAETDSIGANITTSGTGSTGGDVIILLGGTSVGVSNAYTGTLTISGTNSFQGAGTPMPSGLTANTIAIRSGTLAIGSSDTDSTHGALGGALSKATVTLGDTTGSNNASLLIAGAFNMATPFTVQAGNTGTITIGGSNTTGTASFAGNITVNKAVTLQAATNGTVVFKTGTWTTNNNAVTIGSVGNTGTVEIDNALTTSGGVSVTNGSLLLGNTMNVTGGALAVGTAGTLSSNSSGAVTGNATLTGNGIINLNSASNISGTLGVTGGNWNGGGSVTGAVTSSSGTFNVGSGANLTANGGLNVTGGTVSGTDGTATVTGNVNYSSTATSTYQGVIAGTGKTLSVSAGKLALTNSSGSSYTGGTTVTGGALYVTNGTGSGTGSGTVMVSNTGVILGGSGKIAGAVSVSAGASLYSGGVATGTPTVGPGTGLTLSSTLTVNGGDLKFALGLGDTPGDGKYLFGTPNTNTTYLTLSGSASINFVGTNSISLVDLTPTNSLALRQGTPYLLVSAGSNAAYTDLVTVSGFGPNAVYSLDGNGYVVGVQANGYTGGTSINPSDFTPIAINQYGSDGVTPLSGASIYPDPVLYLDNGNLEVVPEPGTWALMIGGLSVLVAWQRRRRI